MVKPPDFDKTFETFSHEVKEFFYKDKVITCTTWFTFIILNLSNAITIVYSATPSWGWTREMVGANSNDNRLEGEVYGFYGIWYICWEQVIQHPGTQKRSCLLWVFANYMPEWFPAVQAMVTMTFIFGFAAFVILGFYMFAKTLNRNLKFLSFFLLCTCMSVICSITGFVVFVILFLKDAYWCCHPDLKRELIEAQLYYGFILCCVGTGLYMFAVVGGISEAMDILKERRMLEEYEMWEQRERELGFMSYDQSLAGYNNLMMNFYQ